MPDIYDDSLEGSIIEISNPKIEPKNKPHFKGGIDHRFKINMDKKIKADEPILRYVTKKKSWVTARELMNELGMADRTVFHMCKRLTLHGALEMKTKKIGNGIKRNTRLYRVPIKRNNDPRRNKRKSGRTKRTSRKTEKI